MIAPHQFETPENVQVHYNAAGLGTRYIAWFVDQIILILVLFVAFIALIAIGFSFDAVFIDRNAVGSNPDSFVLYMAGIIALLWGLSSFFYFGCCELLLRGQTIGKRFLDIRVVKANGFQLDAASIIIRNVFRVVDQLPPMWIIPLLSKRSQRAGDMVAGTLVVSAAKTELSPVRSALAEKNAGEAVFRFDQTALKKLSPSDFDSVERLLERSDDLRIDERNRLFHLFTDRLAQKMGVEPPESRQRATFLQDLLAAELRRRDRTLA